MMEFHLTCKDIWEEDVPKTKMVFRFRQCNLIHKVEVGNVGSKRWHRADLPLLPQNNNVTTLHHHLLMLSVPKMSKLWSIEKTCSNMDFSSGTLNTWREKMVFFEWNLTKFHYDREFWTRRHLDFEVQNNVKHGKSWGKGSKWCTTFAA